MFRLLKLTAQVLLKPYQVTDQESCRKFLLDIIELLKPLAEKTGNVLDNAMLKQVEFMVKSDVLFAYVYRLMMDQIQTEEILVESIDETLVAEMMAASAPAEPEAVNPAVIISLISQIISLINTLKNQQ